MSYSPQAPGRTLAPHSLDDLNLRIRHLMSEPAGDRRAQEYRRLLWLWAEVSRSEVVEAA